MTILSPALPPSRSRRRYRWLAWSSALVCGLSLALASPRFGYVFLVWIALVPLLQALDFPGVRGWQRAALGWLAGLVASLAGGQLELTAAGVALAALAGLPVGLFTALAPLALRQRNHAVAVAATAAGWTALEYVLADGLPAPLGALPWPGLSLSLAPDSALLQSADLFGLWGLSFLIAAANASLGRLFTSGPLRRRAAPAVLLAAGVLILHYRGASILSEGADGQAPAAAVLIHFGGENAALGKELTREFFKEARRSGEAPRLILWPAFEERKPFADPALRPALAALAKETGSSLIAGAGAAALVIPPEEGGGIFESAQPAIFPWTAAGLPGAPPLLGLLPPQDSYRSSAFRGLVENGAQALVAPLFEDRRLSEPEKLRRLRLHCLRAIECRRWLLRCAGGGHSAVIDAAGRLEASITSPIEGTLAEEFSRRVGGTVFVRWGWLIGPGCCLLSAVGVSAALLRRGSRARARLAA